jgi:monoamine oxidase
MSTNTIVHCKVAIIGAGVAGLAAAEKLLAAGFHEFLMFEALERVGGRVCTEKSG